MHSINDLSSSIVGAAIEVKLGGWKLGLLINFHVPLLKEGIKRVVLGLEEPPESVATSHG